MRMPVGGSTEVSVEEIVGIFDLEHGISASVQEFLEKNKHCVTTVETEPRSMIVTAGTIYMSPVSANTLRRRIIHDARIYG